MFHLNLSDIGKMLDTTFCNAFDKIFCWAWSLLPDNCEVCHGKQGGVKGNENVMDGKVMCDFCTFELLEERERGEIGRRT